MMRKFIIHTVVFVIVVVSIITAALFLIPNKKIENNSLFSNIDKHHRLDSLSGKKIVFIGGSNLAFGLNSKTIEDSLRVPVVNMGLHAGLGLRYMLSEVRTNIHKGDVVVVSPEYHQFIGEMYLGEKVLVALLFDVNRENIKCLSFGHSLHLIPQIIEYSASKLFFKKLDILCEANGDNYVKNFKRNSFNKYGDESMHWSYPNQKVNQMSIPDSNVIVSDKSIQLLLKFKDEMIRKGATVYIVPPALQKSSFDKLSHTVLKIETALNANNLSFSIHPQEFAYPDSLFFNTIYHLDKTGADLRSERIIQFLKNNIQ